MHFASLPTLTVEYLLRTIGLRPIFWQNTFAGPMIGPFRHLQPLLKGTNKSLAIGDATKSPLKLNS
jgi:hypothetical protein